MKTGRMIQLLVQLVIFIGMGTIRSIFAQENADFPLVTSLDWASDGSRIAIGWGRWDAQLVLCETGSDILLLDPLTNQVNRFSRPDATCSPTSVGYNLSDSTLALTSNDRYEIWNASTGEIIQSNIAYTAFLSAIWSPIRDEILVTAYPYVETVKMSLLGADSADFRSSPGTRFVYSDWSPDGQQAATITTDGRINVWSTVTGEVLTTFTGHTAPVKRLSWNPVSNTIASGDDSGTIWIWNAATGDSIRSLTGHSGIVYDVDWNLNGIELVSGGADGLRVWDATTGTGRLVNSGFVSAVAYSTDGTRLAYGGLLPDPANPAVSLIDAPPVVLPLAQTLPESSVTMSALQVSPGGTQIAVATVSGSLKLYDATTLTVIRTLQASGDSIISIGWSPDGTRIAAITFAGRVSVWNSSSGNSLYSIILQNSNTLPHLSHISWSPNGSQLGVSGLTLGTIILEASTGMQLFDLGTGDTFGNSWSPSANLTVSAYLGVFIWKNNTLVKKLPSLAGIGAPGIIPDAISYNTNGDLLAIGINRFDLPNPLSAPIIARPILEIRQFPSFNLLRSVEVPRGGAQMRWNRDSSLIAIFSLDGMVRIFEVSTLCLVAEINLGTSVMASDWMNDSQLVYASNDGTLNVVDVTADPTPP